MRRRAGGRRCAGFSPAAGLLLLAALLLIASLIWLLNSPSGNTPADPGITSPEEFHEPLQAERLGSLPPEVLDRAEPAEEIPAERAVFEPYSLLNDVDRIRELHGIVLRPDGQPCANAVVIVQKPWSQGLRLTIDDKILERREVARLRTNSLGEWKRAVNPGTWYEVEARYDKWIAAPVLECQAGERIDIRLSEPGVIHGIVTAVEGGEPLLNMTIFARHWVAGKDEDRKHEGVTQLDGSYRLEGLEPGNWRIGVYSERHDAEAESLVLEPGQTLQQDFQLHEGLVCQGRVLDAESGSPLPGAEVAYWVFSDPHAICDQQGRFVLPGIPLTEEPRERITLDARAIGYGRRTVNLAWDPARSYEIKLSRGIVVTGRIVLPSSAPAGGAYVAIVSTREREGEVTQRDWQIAMALQSGSFIIRDVRPDLDRGLVIRRPGSATLYRELPVLLESQERHDLGTIQLSAASTIAGTVTTEDGSIIPDCEVSCSGTSRDLGLWNAEIKSGVGYSDGAVSGRTDDLGRFRFTDLAPGKYSLSARAPGFCDSHLMQDDHVELLEGETREHMRLIMKPGVPVEGKIVNPEGKPVEGAYLTLQGDPPVKDPPEASTDRDGKFRFYQVPPGTYRLEFDPLDRYQRLTGEAHYEKYVRSGLVVGVGMKKLVVKLERTATITGAVTDVDGRPALAIVSALNAAGELIVEAPSDADGRFELRMLEGLTVNLVARFADPQANAHLPAESQPRARFDAIPVGARDVQLRIPGRP